MFYCIIIEYKYRNTFCNVVRIWRLCEFINRYFFIMAYLMALLVKGICLCKVFFFDLMCWKFVKLWILLLVLVFWLLFMFEFLFIFEKDIGSFMNVSLRAWRFFLWNGLFVFRLMIMFIFWRSVFVSFLVFIKFLNIWNRINKSFLFNFSLILI